MSLYINGEWQEGQGELFTSTNPATTGTVWQGRAANTNQIETALHIAHQAKALWQRHSFEERAAYCLRFAALLDEQQNALASIISEEMGKPLWESLQEVASMIKKVAISIQAYQERCLPKETISGAMASVVRYRPHGVVAVFGPFNFPGHLPSGHIIPALLAGNTILFKPSELTPKTGEWLTRFWHEAGLPKGVFNLLQGSKEVAVHITSLSGIDGIFFTGSQMAGQAIAKESLKFPHRIVALEMGGNNPLIVSHTAALPIHTIIQSAFLTTGQRCSCARRLILIQNSQTEHLLEELVKETSAIHIGAYTDHPAPYMGPVVSEHAANTLIDGYTTLLANGGKPLLAMKRLERKGSFVSPGIVDMTGCQREDVEYFGPLLQCIRVKDLKEAIAVASETTYGLSAGILSSSAEEYDYFYARVKAGVINWNCPLTGASSLLPFGGIGKSGNHRPSGYFACDYCSYPVASQEARPQ